MVRALAPASAKLLDFDREKAQGLKPNSFCAFSARLKSCPDTKQESLLSEPRSSAALGQVLPPLSALLNPSYHADTKGSGAADL
jgi:hypothetical protein